MPELQETFFRKAAIDHYLAAEDLGDVTRISPPWTWALVAVLATALGSALVLSIVGRIAISDRGVGILRPSGGVRALVAPTGGVVSRVDVNSGDNIQKGASILNLESAELQSSLLSAESEIRLLKSESHVYAERETRMFAEQEAALRARLRMLQAEVASQEESVVTFRRKLARSVEMEKSGLISPTTTDDVREALAQSERQLSSSKRSVAQTEQELSSIRARREDDLWQQQKALETAQNRRDGLAFSLQEMQVRAPVDGTVEAVVVKPGDVVLPNQLVGKLISRETAYQVVSFLPEKDRAFVHVGDEVKLELEQFPYEEFGTLKGRVQRISNDLASSQEIHEAGSDELKLNGSTYRVEVRLLTPASSSAQALPLRTGMLLNVRYTLRRERPIVFFFAPLRRWID